MNNPANDLLRDVVSRQQSKLYVRGIIIAFLAMTLIALLAKRNAWLTGQADAIR